LTPIAPTPVSLAIWFPEGVVASSLREFLRFVNPHLTMAWDFRASRRLQIRARQRPAAGMPTTCDAERITLAPIGSQGLLSRGCQRRSSPVRWRRTTAGHRPDRIPTGSFYRRLVIAAACPTWLPSVLPFGRFRCWRPGNRCPPASDQGSLGRTINIMLA
jgi:hypothetical protein